MKIDCIGVGEAFEPKLGNASFLVEEKQALLIDCGYAVPRNYFSRKHPPDFLDAIYITHFHADHTFGVPPLINRWNEDGRKKPLTFIGQRGVKDYIQGLIDLGYPNCRSKLKYPLKFLESEFAITFNEWKLNFAQTSHGMKNYAITITTDQVCLGVSGDGGLTPLTKSLFQDCHILIHEAFGFDQAATGHTHALEVVEFAKTLTHLKTLALVHIHRDVRTHELQKFFDLQKNVPFQLLIPEPGDLLTI